MAAPLQVAVSVWGRFHGFDLARVLAERGALAQLVTSYPRFFAVRYGIPGALVDTHPALEVLARAWRRLPGALQRRFDPNPRLVALYDRLAARSLRPGADLFVGWSGASLLSLRRAKALGMRTVLERGSAHIAVQKELLDEEYRRFGHRAVSVAKETLERELLEYEECDYFSIPSLFVRRTFLERGVPAEKLIHVPYGVDMSVFRPMPRAAEKTFRVVYCGQLSLRKGLPYLLQAFHELALPDAELSLVGAVLPELESELARYRAPNVLVHGPKPRAALSHWFSQGDLFCLPSVEDGFGLVLLQAMACGLPVLATTNTGAADLVREGREGFLVGIRDVAALKDRLRWCYENREACRELGRAARERAREAAGWDQYGEAMLAHYGRALERLKSSA